MNAAQRPSINQLAEPVRRTSAQELLDRAQALLNHACDMEDEVWRKLQCIMRTEPEELGENKKEPHSTHPEFFENMFSTLASIEDKLASIQKYISKVEF